jgi:hypothetical protein
MCCSDILVMLEVEILVQRNDQLPKPEYWSRRYSPHKMSWISINKCRHVGSRIYIEEMLSSHPKCPGGWR